jgi:DNA-binding CsgD family transcriptional regulator
LHASGFTPRESEAILWTTQGLTVAERAKKMNCSKASVQDRINTLFYKLDVNSTPALITKAFQSGFLKFLALAAFLNIGVTMPSDHAVNRVRVSRVQVVRVKNQNRENA